jgi:hypothetical protein
VARKNEYIDAWKLANPRKRLVELISEDHRIVMFEWRKTSNTKVSEQPSAPLDDHDRLVANITRLFQKGKSSMQISVLLGLRYSQVLRELKRAGLIIPKTRNLSGDQESTIDRMLLDGARITDIATATGVSRKTIYERSKKTLIDGSRESRSGK